MMHSHALPSLRDALFADRAEAPFDDFVPAFRPHAPPPPPPQPTPQFVLARAAPPELPVFRCQVPSSLVSALQSSPRTQGHPPPPHASLSPSPSRVETQSAPLALSPPPLPFERQDSPSAQGIHQDLVSGTPEGSRRQLLAKGGPEKQYTCPEPGCGKPFSKLGGLKRHLRIHNNEKPFKCRHPGCGAAFAESGNLTRHIRSHTNERPYTCRHANCGKAFKTSSHQVRHEFTHTGEKPFECGRCGKAYVQNASLKQHQLKHGHCDEEDDC